MGEISKLHSDIEAILAWMAQPEISEDDWLGALAVLREKATAMAINANTIIREETY